MIKIKFTFLLFILLQANFLLKAGVILDTTFNHTGEVFKPFGNSLTAVSHVIQTDGRIIAAGNGKLNGISHNVLMRFMKNGIIDSSYGINGVVSDTFPNTTTNQLHGVVLQNDGKLITAGIADSVSKRYVVLARYETNGTPDVSFGINGKVMINMVSASILAVALQSDGKIVAAGSNAGEFAVYRFNQNGSIDNSFGSGGMALTAIGTLPYDAAKAILIQPDGKIVAGGDSYQSLYYLATLVRYNADGSLDASFGTGGITVTSVQGYYDEINHLSLQGNGKIVATGTTTYDAFGTTQNSFMALRYDANGILDAAFGNAGMLIASIGTKDDKCFSNVIQQDGKIILAGYTTDASVNLNFVMLRLNTDGTYDTSFGNGAIVETSIVFGTTNYNDHGQSVALQADGKIVLLGHTAFSNSSQFALVRYTTEFVLGLSDIERPYSSFHVYPNPCHDQLTIQTNIKSTAKEYLQLFNTNGERIYSQQIENQQAQIPMAQFAAGEYLIRYNNQTHKILKK